MVLAWAPTKIRCSERESQADFDAAVFVGVGQKRVARPLWGAVELAALLGSQHAAQLLGGGGAAAARSRSATTSTPRSSATTDDGRDRRTRASEPRLRRDAARGGGVSQGVVVALVLVGVGFGE